MIKMPSRRLGTVLISMTLIAAMFFLFYRKTPSPNIVLIVIDTLRKDHLGLYGYKRKTMPFIEDSAQKGVVFRNFYATSSSTVPSHYSLFSSQLPDPTRTRIEASFVDQLKSIQYRTYGVSANPLVSEIYSFNRGFDVFMSDIYKDKHGSPKLEEKFRDIEKLSTQKNVYSEFIKIHLAATADITNEKIFQILERHVGEFREQPYFFFINYLDPHDPYFPHSANPIRYNYNVRDEFGSLLDFWHRVPELGQNELRELTDLYDGEITYADQQIQNLVKKMGRMGLARNTVFIITSDHGEILGEHRLFSHNLALYEEELKIPMIIFGHGIKKMRIDAPFSHMDTGDLVLSSAQRKLRFFLERSPFRFPLVHRHYVYETDIKSLNFLPVFCQVDLFRLSYPDRWIYYYRRAGQDVLEVYDDTDQEMRHNRMIEKPLSFRAELLVRIRNWLTGPSPKPSLSPEELQKLKSLGYIY